MASELADQVSLIPKLFAATDKSTACLLKEFGFPQARHALSVDDLEAILKRDPHLADLGSNARRTSALLVAGASKWEATFSAFKAIPMGTA